MCWQTCCRLSTSSEGLCCCCNAVLLLLCRLRPHNRESTAASAGLGPWEGWDWHRNVFPAVWLLRKWLAPWRAPQPKGQRSRCCGTGRTVGLGLSSLLSRFGKNMPLTLLPLQHCSFHSDGASRASPAFLVSLQSPRPAPSLLVDVCGWAGSCENKVLTVL